MEKQLKMKRFLHWFLKAFNPTLAITRYRVEWCDWSCGGWKCCWFYKRAKRYALLRNEYFMTIVDELAGKREKVRFQKYDPNIGGYLQFIQSEDGFCRRANNYIYRHLINSETMIQTLEITNLEL